jgi:1-deoxy-D-xylulose-5-phosphate reductoisomerase
MLAHMGPPDMRIAISYALNNAQSVGLTDGPRPVLALDLAAVGLLSFESVDLDAFPCLRLARAAACAGGTAPCVLNAANEIAVHAFLQGRLGFLEIAEVIERTLHAAGSQPVQGFESLYEADRLARELAGECVAGLS